MHHGHIIPKPKRTKLKSRGWRWTNTVEIKAAYESRFGSNDYSKPSKASSGTITGQVD